MLAVQVRSGLSETFHDGAVAVCGPDGQLIARSGDIERPFFIRSAAKPFQAKVSRDCGADLDGERLALACASHSAEPIHVALVDAILKTAGLEEKDLQCPPDWPLRSAVVRRLVASGEREPRRIWNNCSGKHAAMLAACVAGGFDPGSYLDPGHPLQKRIAAFMSEVGGPVEPLGVDGCGAPVFRTTTASMARAFATLATSPDLASVQTAMHSYPRLVSGTGRVDGAIAAATNAVAKGGAMGTLGVAVRGRLGIAVKCWDGSGTVAGLTAIESLRLLGYLPDHAASILSGFREPPVLGGGRVVGRYETRLRLSWI
jgi:L-asparaginase II